jgi:phage terminase large subunit
LDFGYSVDPTCLVDIYYWNGSFIIDEQIYQKGLSNKSIADLIKNLPQPQTMIICDSAEPKSIDELKMYGINAIPAIKGQGSVYQGIQYVQGQKIWVTSRSVHTIKAYRNYMFHQDPKTGVFSNDPDDTVHEWSNAMDAIRYGLDSYRPKREPRPHRPKQILQGYKLRMTNY